VVNERRRVGSLRRLGRTWLSPSWLRLGSGAVTAQGLGYLVVGISYRLCQHVRGREPAGISPGSVIIREWGLEVVDEQAGVQ
jgi:hypothetical protein